MQPRLTAMHSALRCARMQSATRQYLVTEATYFRHLVIFNNLFIRHAIASTLQQLLRCIDEGEMMFERTKLCGRVVLNNTSCFCFCVCCSASREAPRAYPPKPYSVLPWRLSAYTTSIAVTVLRRACSV